MARKAYGPKIAEDKAEVIEEFCERNLIPPHRLLTYIIEEAADHLKEIQCYRQSEE